jgi:asparagine synthase (glutamine-hydrolysing)
MTRSEVTIIGYCNKTPTELSALLEDGKANQLLRLRGEYTLIFVNDDVVTIITSYVGAMQYCYYYDGEVFSHGKTILEIIKQVRLEWKWDWESVGDLCELENLTENRTLHKYIKKVPPGSILRYDRKLTIHSSKYIDTFKTHDIGDAVEAVDIFNEETSYWASRKPYLSLSGGFDSRTILSSMLTQNIYPTLVTLGNEESSDIEVSKEISKEFGLEHIVVKLELDELLENGVHIARITNGSKPACHWHTYLYPRKAQVPKNESFYVGTLGEFARSYYFDKGIAGIMLDMYGVTGQEIFWNSKLKRHRTFKDTELSLLSPDFAKELQEDGHEYRSKRNAKLSDGGVLTGGCRYYLEQRVPNFYANGITMYNDTTQWRSPFHNLEWLKMIWNLSDNWKLGSNWHRLAIKRNFPKLLDFSEEKGFAHGRMLGKAPPFYWLSVMQRMKYKSYDLSDEWYRDKKIREFILDSRDTLADLCEPLLVERVLDAHLGGESRVRAISFFLTMIYFKKALRNG